MTNRDTLVMLRNSVGIKNIPQGIGKTDFCNPFGYPLGIRDWGIFLLLSPMGIRYPLLHAHARARRCPMSRYEDEYRKWVESLPPKQRAKLAAKGIDKPLADDHRVFKTDPSVAFDKASYDFSYDFLDSQEKPSETLEGVEIAYGCQMLRWVFERLQGAKNEGIRRLEIDTLMMTLGMEQMLGVKSQTELAKKYGITRAAISARVKSWQKFLGLRTTSTMKSPSACQSYRNSRLRNLTSG